jgi:biotin transport system substrate-specific component
LTFSAYLPGDGIMSYLTRLTLPKYLDYTERGVLAQAFWIVVFAAGTVVGARIEVPHHPVPYTLQTLSVLLAGAFLGSRNGALSQLLYIGLGVAGAPVFAGSAFGMAVLFGPTGGYLLGFPIAAAVVGYLIHNRKGHLWSFVSMTAGLLVVFICGTLYLYATTIHDAGSAIAAGFLVFTLWDLMKLSAAAMIYNELSKRWRKIPE